VAALNHIRLTTVNRLHEPPIVVRSTTGPPR
jgi:hypothetical protein